MFLFLTKKAGGSWLLTHQQPGTVGDALHMYLSQDSSEGQETPAQISEPSVTQPLRSANKYPGRCDLLRTDVKIQSLHVE